MYTGWSWQTAPNSILTTLIDGDHPRVISGLTTRQLRVISPPVSEACPFAGVHPVTTRSSTAELMVWCHDDVCEAVVVEGG